MNNYQFDGFGKTWLNCIKCVRKKYIYQMTINIVQHKKDGIIYSHTLSECKLLRVLKTNACVFKWLRIILTKHFITCDIKPLGLKLFKPRPTLPCFGIGTRHHVYHITGIFDKDTDKEKIEWKTEHYWSAQIFRVRGWIPSGLLYHLILQRNNLIV